MTREKEISILEDKAYVAFHLAGDEDDPAIKKALTQKYEALMAQLTALEKEAQTA